MKQPSYRGTILLLTALVLLWGGLSPFCAVAAVKDPHAGHDHGHGHGHQETRAPAAEDLDDLFDAEEDHGDHDPAEESAHAGHDHGDHGEEGADGEICPEHQVPEAIDALCHGDHLDALAPGEGMLVRLASPEVAAKAGIALSRPQLLSLAPGVAFPGRTAFDRQRLARITPLAAGTVRQVLVRPGAQVSAGEVLVEIAMPEIISLKAQLLAAQARSGQAAATFERESDLLARGITSRQEFQQAEADDRVARSEVDRVRTQLLNYGLSAAEVDALQPGGHRGESVALRAPFAGVVAELATAAGESVAPGIPLLTVVDTESFWVEISVPESRIFQLQAGVTVEARFDGLPGSVFHGRIFQVGTAVDARSRTLGALAEVQNPGQRLKAGMFGQVRILGGKAAQVLAVPAAALQSIDGHSYLFLQRAPDLFELRRVEAGPPEKGLVPIRAGLAAEEPLVTAQGFALKSEILKARLGASCADH